MKRLISILLLVLMLFTPVTAYAADDSIRHEVHGDVSKIIVSDELDQGDVNDAMTEATMGTDVYLFVDPDTASYITFYVTDEQGYPLKDARIYISYNEKSEFYGSTDKDGKFKTYLFRDTEYGYSVLLDGYEEANGRFTATKETKFVRVVLRRYYSLDIFVVDGDKPVSNTEVYIDGVRYVTDKDGKVTTYKTNGVCDVVVHTADGRQIPVRVEVDGNTKKVIDIGEDDSIIPGGSYSDRFLVYNKDYNPEDYVLTKYLFTEKDVAEKDKDAYLDETSNTVLVQAQPERKQNSDGTDTDILKNNKPLYAQRSLMPTGYLLKAWQDQDFENLVFTNEDMALKLSMDQLHEGKMMELYSVLWYLTEYPVDLEDIATEKVKRKWDGYERSGLMGLEKWSLDVNKIPYEAIRDDFEFAFDIEEKEESKELPQKLYTNTLFEFKITPILREAMEEMITDGLTGAPALPQDEIMVASWGYFKEELRRHLADGKLSEAECGELYEFFVDGKLTADEIKELKSSKLSKNAVDLLLDAAADEKLYRVSVWLFYDDAEVNITNLLDLELLRNMDEEFEAEYELQYNEKLKTLEKNQKIDEKQLALDVEKTLQQRYDFMIVDNESNRFAYTDYKPGEMTEFTEPELIRSLDEEGKFVDVIKAKSFEQFTVDVCREIYSPAKNAWRYKANVTPGTAALELQRAITVPHTGSALVGLSIDN